MKLLVVGHTESGTSALALRLSRMTGFTVDAMSFTDVTDDNTPLPECDGVVVTVHLLEGPMPGTREAIRRAHLGNTPIVGLCMTHLDAFLAQTEIKPAIRELVLWETRELCSQYGYTDGAIPACEATIVTGCETELKPFVDAVVAYAAAGDRK